MSKASGFALSKWYLDCVSDEGDAFIAYSAELRWGAIAVSYTGTLVQRAGRPTEIRATLRSAPAPGTDAGVTVWSAPALGVSGRWTAVETRAAADAILEGPEGSVTWRCLVPRARAEIVFARAPAIAGLGYVEHLSVTMAPWQLPIDELRWGRLLSADASLVWIDWRGPYRKKLALLGGELVEPVHVGDLEVEAGPARLTLSEPRILRRGELGKTALAVLPAARSILPVRILATDERKWVSRGTLDRGGKTSQGWAIHEVVRWP
jgi:hypothetical protein